MRSRNENLGLLALVMLLHSSAVNAAESRQLTHNPFARPPSEVTIGARSPMNTDNPEWELDLRATLVATRDKLANVGGKILRPGDEVQGYTLLQVFEDHAVFTREGRRLTIYVKPDPDDDDE